MAHGFRHIVLEGPVTQTGKRLRLNWTATDMTGPLIMVLLVTVPVRSRFTDLETNSKTVQDRLEPVSNWTLTPSVCSCKHIYWATLCTLKVGHTWRKAQKCEPFIYHGLFVCICMVMHFCLRVFDAFTLSVYMFTLICMALPQPAMWLTSLPPPPTTRMHRKVGSKQQVVVWAPW